eukprot:TRINITY_DN19474_c0_g1_i2.p1 TRINITY_DN19474_c0_g1~~TRINITY_DN19474_c0_g1_i2.p1  ORF type:complete len:915 (-),score=187.09 TRINITY_DN19474_c0_g1_i2:283-3027(-)
MNASRSSNNPRRRSRRNKKSSRSGKNGLNREDIQEQNKVVQQVDQKEVLQHDFNDEGEYLSFISSVGVQEKSLAAAVQYIKKFKLVVSGIVEEELLGVQEVKPEGPLVPSGKRHSGQGVENEEQGILFIAHKDSGEIVLDVTQLVAGFIIGPKGVSIREISNLTGCQMKSWTVDEDGVSIRPCRNFVLSGSPQSVLQSLDIILATIGRYKELAEGAFSGRSVNRIQKIKGVDFFYYPPPKTKISYAASIQGAPQGFSCGGNSSGNLEQLGDDRFVLQNRGGGGKPTTLSIRKALQLSEENVDDVAAKHAGLFPGKMYTRLTRSQRRSQSRQNSRRARRNTGQNNSSNNDQFSSENSTQNNPTQKIESQNSNDQTQIIQNQTANKGIRSIETQTTTSNDQKTVVIDQNKYFEELELMKILQKNEQKDFITGFEISQLDQSVKKQDDHDDKFVPQVAPPVPPVIEAEKLEKIAIFDARKNLRSAVSRDVARSSEIVQLVSDEQAKNLLEHAQSVNNVPRNVQNVGNILPQNSRNVGNASQVLSENVEILGNTSHQFLLENVQNAVNVGNASKYLPANVQNAGNDSETMESLQDRSILKESFAENFFDSVQNVKNVPESTTNNFWDDNFPLIFKKSENLIIDDNDDKKCGNLQQVLEFIPRNAEKVPEIFEDVPNIVVSGNLLSEEEVGSTSCMNDVKNVEKKNILDIALERQHFQSRKTIEDTQFTSEISSKISDDAGSKYFSGKEDFPPKNFLLSSSSVAAVIGHQQVQNVCNEGSILDWSFFPENKVEVDSFHPAIGYEVFDKKREEQQKLLYKLFSPDRTGTCEENVQEGHVTNLQSICKYLGDICLDKDSDAQDCIASAPGSCLQRAQLAVPPQSPYINSISGETFFTASSRSFVEEEQTTHRVLEFSQQNQ